MLPYALAVDLHAALLAAVGVVVTDAVARGRLRGAVVLGLCAVAAGWTVAVVSWVDLLPGAWFTPLREGFTPHHLREVTGEALDAAPLRDELWRHLLFPGRTGWRVVVGTNLVHAGLSALLWTGLVLGAVRAWPARLALILGFVWAPAWAVAALSETAAPVLWTSELLAAIGLAWAGAPEAGRAGRLAGLAAAVLAAATLPGLRPEGLALAGGVGLALVGVLAPTRDRALGRDLERGLAVLGARPLLVLGLAAGLAALSWTVPAALPSGADHPTLRWVVGALHPLHVQVVGTGVWLLLALPTLAVLVLLLRGSRRAVERPLAWGTLLLLVGVLLGTMRTAAHGGVGLRAHAEAAPWELLRYGLGLLPLLHLLALLGARGPLGRWVLAAVVWPVLALAALVPGAPDVPGVPRWGAPATSSQREVRALAAWSEAHPHCALLAPGFVWEHEGAEARWYALVPALHGHRLVDLRLDAARPVDEALAAVPGAPTCAQAWWGLDCHAEHRAICVGLRDRPLQVADAWTHVPFVHPDHGVTYAGAPDLVRVGTVDLR